MKCRASSAGATGTARAARSSRADPIAWCSAARWGASSRSRIVSRNRSWANWSPSPVGVSTPATTASRAATSTASGEMSRARAATSGRRPVPMIAATSSSAWVGPGSRAIRRSMASRTAAGMWSTVAVGVVGEQGDFPHEERMTTGAPVDGIGGRTVDGSSGQARHQLLGGVGVDALDVDVLAVADERSEQGPGRGVQLVVAVGADEADPRPVSGPGDEVEEGQRRCVGPVEVVDHDDQAPFRRQAVEQPAGGIEEQEPGPVGQLAVRGVTETPGRSWPAAAHRRRPSGAPGRPRSPAPARRAPGSTASSPEHPPRRGRCPTRSGPPARRRRRRRSGAGTSCRRRPPR